MKKSQFPDESGEDGSFERQEDAFREKLGEDPSSTYRYVPGRYHLYVSLACPWAHRTVLFRQFLGLEEEIGLTVVDPVRDERGWAFREGDGYSRDPVEGFVFLREAYQRTDPDFRGRVTVPVLWDRESQRIVNNSEDDICRMMQNVCAKGKKVPDFFPEELTEEQSRWSEFVYETINNGVYRAGFASTQEAYEKAVLRLFEALDQVEEKLAIGPFLLGEEQTEVDWRLFCTLVRFDAVYVGHFKCNIRRIVDYPRIQAYLRRLLAIPGVKETVRLDHIKNHYYRTHEELNPSGIVPTGPELEWA